MKRFLPAKARDGRRPAATAAPRLAERRAWRVFEYRRPVPAAPRFTT